MTSTGPLARLAGVTKAFGDLEVLTGVDFEVRRGEVFGLLGPNGAGKTTTVRILCGLLAVDTGEVSVAGHDVTRNPLDARRRIGFVPDGAPLYPNLSPLQHLALVGRLHGMSEGPLMTEARRLLDGLDLSDRADDPVGRFSRGMRQKTALACALVHKPELLVLDEPLSGLDAPTATMFKEILLAWAKQGKSVLYTSHLLDIVERVCDRMAILDKGKIVAVGDLEELRTQAGHGGTLEQVFRSLAESEDPAERARKLLGA
ncbi:MAG: ABC transporter ATP-binding protein [bacterium]|nr:ABC transporter ATP-binding protein [bacterium]